MTASEESPEKRAALDSLRRAYGENVRPAQRINHAIRAEVPGGAELMSAVELANSVSHWDDLSLKSIETYTEAAACCVASPALQTAVERAWKVAQSMPKLDNPKALSLAHESLRSTLKEARDLAAEIVLELHRDK
jgi:hypothetical protein